MSFSAKLVVPLLNRVEYMDISLKTIEISGLRGSHARISDGRMQLQMDGGPDNDPVTRVIGSLTLVSERLGEISRHIEAAAPQDEDTGDPHLADPSGAP